MIHFSIDPAYRKLNIQKLLKKAAEVALIRDGNGMGDLTLVLTGDKKIKVLNKQFRGIDLPTDVLSFPTEKSKKRPGYLGDVIISVPRAKVQAKEVGHSLNDELTLLVVHGVLHLLGYDHSELEGKAKMWKAQEAILRELGVSLDVDLAVASYSHH
jgi:probable rRNA maturation factor